MLRYLTRRLMLAVITVLGVSIIVFVLLRAVPGDPAGLMFTPGQASSLELQEAIRHEMGLDQPLWAQYGLYLGDLARGDLGHSYQSKMDVRALVFGAAPATLQLAAGALLVSLTLGLAAGILSAIRQYSILDYGTVLLASLGMAAPVFWVGLVLILVFSIELQWLPAAGRYNLRNPGGFPDLLRHLILPSLALGLNGAALIARITRSSMLDVIASEYVVSARAKGLTERAIILHHSLRNALLPIVTIIGLQLGYLLGGAVLTETVFNWPGIGTLLVSAISSRDYPVVQGVVLLISILFVMVNIFVDILYALLDPRVRYG